MSPYSEMIRLYGFEMRKERMREAEQWRLCSTPIHSAWLVRQGSRLLCGVGSQLIRVGRYLQTLYESPDPLKA